MSEEMTDKETLRRTVARELATMDAERLAVGGAYTPGMKKAREEFERYQKSLRLASSGTRTPPETQP